VTHNFAPGDMVEVADGELIHLQGKIISIDGNKITMLPKHEDLKVGCGDNYSRGFFAVGGQTDEFLRFKGGFICLPMF